MRKALALYEMTLTLKQKAKLKIIRIFSYFSPFNQVDNIITENSILIFNFCLVYISPPKE